MARRKQYSEEFKKDAVRLVQARGTRTVQEIAAELGVNASMLNRWHARYGGEVAGRGVRSQAEREDVEALRRRVRELEQENAFLKKCAALFAKDVK
ncbi:transposase [Haliangium sp.]|uniref:transposase n=1 Tax=Haliangium sp. TaxID=2663208 RepID=UPI003D10FEE6